MPTDDREQQFERALARHLPNASPDSACPDAEILAAFHERALPLEEMARWKEHIAACTRCQESLALVEQSEDVRQEEGERENVPVPGEDLALPMSRDAAGSKTEKAGEVFSVLPALAAAEPIHKITARPRWRWIVPVGALAASVIVWVAVEENHTLQKRSIEKVQVAQNPPAATQPLVEAYEVTNQLKKGAPPAQKPSESLRAKKVISAPSAKLANPKVSEPAARPSTPATPAIDAENSKPKDLGFSATDKFAATAPAPPMPRDLVKSRAERAPAPSAANAIAPAGAAVGGAVANRPAEEKMKAAVPEAAETVEVQAEAVPSTASRLDRKKQAVADLRRRANEDHRYVLAPGEGHVWRVGQGGKIEASTDLGINWQVQKSGVLADLTAGSAPSEKICWVVGKAGTVLLTTDGGKHWKPVPSPVTGDIGGVHATDALHASIRDVSNRASFETSDGGATWRQISNE